MKNKPYMNLVGSLLYAATSTRPDIENSVRLVSRYTANPGPQHWKAARRILRYLEGTPKLGITFGGILNGIYICAYSDAAYASCVDTRRSVSAFVCILEQRNCELGIQNPTVGGEIDNGIIIHGNGQDGLRVAMALRSGSRRARRDLRADNIV